MLRFIYLGVLVGEPLELDSFGTNLNAERLGILDGVDRGGLFNGFHGLTAFTAQGFSTAVAPSPDVE